MKTTDISNKLDELNDELNDVYSMSESDICAKYNVDTKDEIIEIIREEIQGLQMCNEREDDGMDYINLQLSQGMSVLYW